MNKNFILHLVIQGLKFSIQNTVKVGIGICWDQWFSEVARAHNINGCGNALYPTAIGKPVLPKDKNHWQNVMTGLRCSKHHSCNRIQPYWN